MDMEKLFANLHLAMGESLLAKVLDGTATTGDLSVARQWLKDNHVTAPVEKGTPLDALNEAVMDLPTFEDDDNVVQMGAKPSM